jgi:hypothetical protein
MLYYRIQYYEEIRTTKIKNNTYLILILFIHYIKYTTNIQQIHYKYIFLFTIFSRSLRYILRFFLSLMIYL